MALAQFVTPTYGGILAAAVVALLSLIQVSKIEINPWTWLARKFGNAINHDISLQIKAVDKRIDDVEASIKDIRQAQADDRAATEENKAITSRVRILRFNEELLRNEKHSKEMFDQTLTDVTNYTHYCKEHPEFENDRAVLAIQNIRRCYQKCQEEHDFI